jgi:uncharacterized protein with ACT and thioredoxin-like domain
MPSEQLWIAVTAITSILTLLVIVIGGGVMWGRITEKVSGLTKRADSHRAELQSHDVRLNTHDVAIGRLEEWKAGYNAAVHAGGRSTEA